MVVAIKNIYTFSPFFACIAKIIGVLWQLSYGNSSLYIIAHLEEMLLLVFGQDGRELYIVFQYCIARIVFTFYPNLCAVLRVRLYLQLHFLALWKHNDYLATEQSRV